MELININNYKYQNKYEDEIEFDYLFEDEEIFNSLFKEDIFPFRFGNKNSKNIFINKKIYFFVKKYHNNKWNQLNKYERDYKYIKNYFTRNKYIFPSKFKTYDNEDLEKLILYQIESFEQNILNNNINKILKDPNYIIQFIDEYKDNDIFIALIGLCYIISLIHNEYSKFLIYTLVQCIPIGLYIKNNIIYFISSKYDEFNFNIEVFKSFKKIDQFSQYLHVK